MQLLTQLNSQLNSDLTPTSIAIYIRVSTDKQDVNTSKPNQLNAINALISQNHWTHIPTTIYSDTKSASISPKTEIIESDSYTDPSVFSRPGLQKLLFDAYSHKFDTLIVYSHDRLTRESQEAIILKYTFTRLNISVKYAKAGEESNSGNKEMDKFFDNLLNSISSLESNIIGGRVKLGNEYNIKHNIWAGGTSPFGYILIPYHKNRKKNILKVYPPQARIVKEIFNLYIQGNSPKEIVQLIKISHPTNDDRAWTTNTIKGILNNPVYIGKLYWNKRGGNRNPKRRRSDEYISSSLVLENQIISEDIWNRCQQIKELQRQDSKFFSTPFLLKNYLFCKECGNNLLTKNYGSKSTDNRWYYCNAKDKTHYHLHLKANKIEADILDALCKKLSEFLSSEDNFNNFYKNYIYELTKRNEASNTSILILTDELKKSNDLLNKCTSKIEELTSDNSTILSESNISKQDTNKFNDFIYSLHEFKNYITLSIKNIEDEINSNKKSITYSLPSKEAIYNILTEHKLNLYKILQLDISSRNKSLRMMFLDSIYKFEISKDKTTSSINIEIIFK